MNEQNKGFRGLIKVEAVRIHPSEICVKDNFKEEDIHKMITDLNWRGSEMTEKVNLVQLKA